MDYSSIGRRIQARRKEMGMVQSQLARQLNVTSSAVSLWERGLSAPAGKNLQLLASILECDTGWLLTGKGDNSPSTLQRNQGDLTEKEMHLIDLFRKIPDHEQAEFEKMLSLRVDYYNELFTKWLAAQGDSPKK
ncbi:hypothetical protein DK750_23935 [Salmonella enterica subsp. enterica serovar Rovaniemi]|nr:hypothetical protein [Salmonella enterica subsp. enterica serovar Rovaniemi]EDR7342195.1 helix-turn-helix domain-containing protein [Salmonella enterica subsp. salamae]EEI6243391.1 helix-turn-helix domain-containing protein [Salmonella enterica subsp. enterica serovar Tudu]HCM2254698.1 helix-turn-helix domain-containing protein [Salmonella enterica subsp. enterica serovar Agbeni]